MSGLPYPDGRVPVAHVASITSASTNLADLAVAVDRLMLAVPHHATVEKADVGITSVTVTVRWVEKRQMMSTTGDPA